MLCRAKFKTREEWLIGRNRQGIGGSEIAACCGLSPFMSARELWEIKTGRRTPKDLSGNAAVEQGVRLEPALRNLYAAMNPSYSIEYHQYDLLYQTERPWGFVTLDGEVTDDKGRRGILEIKTATPSGKAGWEEWANGKVKPAYYAQLLWQMLCTGYSFADLAAGLFSLNGDMTFRVYHFEREDCAEDMEWVLGQGKKFWQHVVNGTMPPTILTF